MVIALLGLAAWYLGWQRARSFAPTGGVAMRMPALPTQHASFLMLCTVVPALLVAAIWPSVSSRLIMRSVMTLPAARNLPASAMDRDSVLSEAAGLADGSVEGAFNPLSYELAKPIAEASHFYTITGAVLLVALALIGFAIGYFRLKPAFKARQKVEGVVMLALMLASLVALVTTFGIVASLVFETGRFFTHVPVTEFLFSTHWAPASDVVAAENNGFGAVPLFWGTIFIGAIIAMIVAIPIGVMAAIYLTQYAPRGLRAWLKPALEILAGIPTVVYGYFAALTLAPIVRTWALALGMPDAPSESALAAGLVMGVMIIPIISSMADDSIAAVPGAMRDGALAVGSTK
jgi:phosphate transport system permease protein